MEIEMLLEERGTIQSKIKQAIDKTKEWFENKIESTKDTFNTIKDKIKTQLGKVTKGIFKDKVCTKKITVNVEGKDMVLSNIGDKAEKVFDKIKKLLDKIISMIRTSCSTIIKQCSNALSSLVTIEKIDYEAIERAEREEALRQARLEKIQATKEKVMDDARSLTEIIVVAGSLIAAITTLKEATKKLKNKGGDSNE